MIQKPDKKVSSGALAGAVTVVLVWVLRAFDIEVPGEIGAALATIIGFGTSYLVPN